jgi:hypothetical protein
MCNTPANEEDHASVRCPYCATSPIDGEECEHLFIHGDDLNRHPKSSERILAWAKAKKLDAVVWTLLPRRFNDVTGIPFTPQAELKYLNELLAYIHSAPEQTMTSFRRLLVAQAGNATESHKSKTYV